MKKAFYKFLFTKIWGWKVEGNYPRDVKKFLITVAPHTSFHDVPIGIMFRNWYDVQINFVIKSEIANHKIVGPFIKWLGGIAVDRNQANNFVHAVADQYDKYDNLYICITPEGTRKKVPKFKSGFYYIATRANIPVLPIIFDFQHKTLHIKELVYLGDDAATEIQRVEDIYKGYMGKHPSQSFG